jgi:plasmid maintenance system antidote protein VapI
MKKIPFAYSIHPGEILHTEFMEPLGLTAYRLAKDIHVSMPRVNDLATYFGNSAEFWLGLQADYDLWVAAKSKTLRKVKPRLIAA